MTKVFSDGTLSGVGTSDKPLKLSNVFQTGFYKPVKKIIDVTLGEHIPSKHLKKGDRYLVADKVSDYGLLYNFDGVNHINKILSKTGWRVPSKSDWDNMLNAIEPCEYRNHNSALNNRVLGMMAGTLLKSEEDWRFPCHDMHHHHDDMHHHHHHFDEHHYHDHHEHAHDLEDEDFEVEEFRSCKPEHGIHKPCHKPEPKPITCKASDSYGMDILPAGYGYFSRPIRFANFGIQGAFWTTDTMYDTDVYTKVFTDCDSGVLQVGERPSTFLSIRLVKDYDGTNYNEVENILGGNYKTVMLPSLNNPNGFSIWTAQNLRFDDHCTLVIEPNAGHGLIKRTVYFTYEWNGFDWDMLELSEGDSIVVFEGKRPNEEYRIVDGVLCNITKEHMTFVKNEVMREVDEVKNRVSALEEASNAQDSKLDAIDAILEDNANKFKEIDKTFDDLRGVDDELNRRDDELEGMIDDLTLVVEANQKNTTQKFEEVEATIDKVKTDLEYAINDLDAKVDTEVARLDEKIDTEVERLDGKIDEAVETLNTRIDTEVARLDAKDVELAEAIETETKERVEADDILEGLISDEAKTREKADAELQEEIDKISEKLDETAELFEKEIATREEQYAETDERLTILEGKALKGGEDGCSYDNETGILTLKAEDDKNTIEVKFSSDYGKVTGLRVGV